MKPCALTFEIDEYGRLLISRTPGWDNVFHTILSWENFMLIWCKHTGYWCVKPEMVGALTDSSIILNGPLHSHNTKSWMWPEYVYYDELQYLREGHTMTWIGGDYITHDDAAAKARLAKLEKAGLITLHSTK